MSQQPAVEPSTRDVLQQIGRRLTLIEDDVRKLHETLDGKIDSVEQRLTERISAVQAKLEARIDGVEQRLGARIDAVEQRMGAGIDTLRAEMNRRFYWMMGVFFSGWLSMMGTMLAKL